MGNGGSTEGNDLVMNIITVAAAIIVNSKQQLLVVRKQNTQYFMQVGGKLESNEAPEVTMLREIEEEVSAKASIAEFVGRFETQAANEADFQLVAYVYHVELQNDVQISAEIVEMKWIELNDVATPLAPLTKEIVIPWVKARFECAV